MSQNKCDLWPCGIAMDLQGPIPEYHEVLDSEAAAAESVLGSWDESQGPLRRMLTLRQLPPEVLRSYNAEQEITFCLTYIS